jgi:branched-chain amino acid transport system permease protein
MLAVRSNERAAAAAGLNVRNIKLAAFGLSSFLAGIAGAMASYNYGSVSANRFTALTGLGVIAFAYIGGITMVSGAIIAALISTEALVPHFWERFLGLSGTWALFVGGIFLIFNLVFYPEGVSGALRKKKDLKKKQAAEGVATPSATQRIKQRMTTNLQRDRVSAPREP